MSKQHRLMLSKVSQVDLSKLVQFVFLLQSV
uniref:Uncharacterized protein n=1 Tax=Rhizophora mucronata TaxID=61149 RepID=A0A2P2P7U5_RHIMU